MPVACTSELATMVHGSDDLEWLDAFEEGCWIFIELIQRRKAELLAEPAPRSPKRTVKRPLVV